MADQRFSIKEAIGSGWNTVKANLGFFIGFLIVAILLQYIPTFLAGQLQKSSAALAFLVRIVSWIVQMVVSMGFLKMALKFHDGAQGEWSDLYSSYPLILNYVAGSILYGLIVFVGTLLLIVPGIIWAIKYQFFGYLIVDQNLGPIEAIKKSGEITKGSKWHLLLFGLAISGVTLLGVLCLFVGLLVAIPVVLMAGVYVYRKLASQAGSVSV